MRKSLSVIILTTFIFSLSSFALTKADNFDYEDYYRLGYTKLLEGAFDDCIGLFQKSVEIKPTSAEAYLGLGMAYRQLGQLDKALDSTKKALQYNPKYYKAYYNLGLIYEAQGNNAQALKAYKTFYNKTPEARNIPGFENKIDRLEKAAGT